MIALPVLLGVSGCYWRIAREPMPSVALSSLGPEQARGAIVLLNGFGGRTTDFDEHGFLRVLRAQAPAYDVIAPDAHYGYYTKGMVVDQLHAHVIGPLVARGYREIWLIGVSMGGHGAVAYARAHPERIKGLLLFAPHLGPGYTVRDVQRAGGVCRYEATMPNARNRAGFAQGNFAWLKDALCGRPPKVSVWVAVGDQDVGASGLLAELIEPDRYLVLPGGHDWNVWTPALAQMIERGALATQ